MYYEEQARLVGTWLASAGWEGWLAGFGWWVSGSKLEWQEVGTGLHSNAVSRQHRGAVLVRVVVARAFALTEENNKTGTKKKRTYMLDYAMHAQLVHRDGAQITQCCFWCKQMINVMSGPVRSFKFRFRSTVPTAGAARVGASNIKHRVQPTCRCRCSRSRSRSRS